MHDILKDTHRDEYINILRAREYFTNKAARYNKALEKFTLIPTIYLIIGYILIIICTFVRSENPFISGIFLFILNLVNQYLELTSGILTIATYFIISFLKKKVDDNKKVSCMLREHYDNKIFKFEKYNPVIYDYSQIDKYLKYADKSPVDYNRWKYEYWYDEVFCDDPDSNIISMQMDNLIYTYRAFSLYRDQLKRRFILSLILTFIAVAATWVIVGPSMAMLMFFAMFTIISAHWENYQVAADLVDQCKRLKEYVDNNLESTKLSKHELALFIEDTIIYTRKNGLLFPQSIRRKRINYYDELNNIKAQAMKGRKIYYPESENDLEVLSTDENTTCTMADIHDHLSRLLKDVADYLEAKEIPYSLDGGTLLGAYKNRDFIFWDDNVNIVVNPGDLDAVKEITEQDGFPDKYYLFDPGSVKDYKTKARLQIREQKDLSLVDEKYNGTLADGGLFLNVRLSEDISPEKTTSTLEFRNRQYHVAENFIDILASEFGDYQKDIHTPSKKLMAEYGNNWFSQTTSFCCSSYRHLRHVNLHK